MKVVLMTLRMPNDSLSRSVPPWVLEDSFKLFRAPPTSQGLFIKGFLKHITDENESHISRHKEPLHQSPCFLYIHGCSCQFPESPERLIIGGEISDIYVSARLMGIVLLQRSSPLATDISNNDRGRARIHASNFLKGPIQETEGFIRPIGGPLLSYPTGSLHRK